MDKPKLHQRRPAELTTFVGSLVLVGGALGLDVSKDVLLAGFVALGLLPSIVTYYASVFRDAWGRLD